jgi:hypothetical protein
MNDLLNKKFDDIKGFVKINSIKVQFEFCNGMISFGFRGDDNLTFESFDLGNAVIGYCFRDNHNVKILFYSRYKMCSEYRLNLSDFDGIFHYSFPISYYIYYYKDYIEYDTMI